MDRVVLVRYGELFLKKGNRSWFLKRLRRNLRQALVRRNADPTMTVQFFEGRLEISIPGGSMDAIQEALALEAASKTFGVVSVSPARRVAATLEALEAAAWEVYADALEHGTPRTFRVHAKRASKHFPMTSPELGRHLGAVLIQRHALPVCLDDPDLTVGVNVLADRAYVYGRRIQGPAGLPSGTASKALLLLSGGIDSPVAGWMMARRGMIVPMLHFHSFPYTTRRALCKVDDLVTALTAWMGPLHLTSMCLTPIQEMLAKEVHASELVLFYRRSMMRLAERLAREYFSQALITGESLGQVASQTMENLTVIQDAVTLPVLRPLVGMDKEETKVLAGRIGTYEISIRPYEDACMLFLPRHPETRGRIDRIRHEETRVWTTLQALEDEAYATREERWIGKQEGS
jgi:thiamine biosynthesis protein ThiI